MRIFCAVGTTASVGFLLVDGDALEEDGLAVEQNLLVACLDGAETNVISQDFAVQGEVDTIEFGVLRRPELWFGAESERGLALSIGGEGLVDFQFWNAQRHLLSSLCLVQVHLKLHLLLCVGLATFHLERLLELEGVVLDIEGSHVDEQHVACDASIIPPVEDLGGHILCMTLVIDLHDDGVLAILELLGHVEIEGCETADVVSNLLAVHIDMAVVVDSTKVEQGVASIGRVPIETLLEPYGALVEEQTFVACVPVRRNRHGGRGVEVIFDEVFRTLWLRIAEEAPRGWVHAVVIIPLLLHIDDVVPVTIQRGGLACHHIAHQWERVSRSDDGEHRPQHECQNKMQ